MKPNAAPTSKPNAAPTSKPNAAPNAAPTKRPSKDDDDNGVDDDENQCKDLSVQTGKVYTFYSSSHDKGCFQVIIGSSADQDNTLSSDSSCTASAFSSTTNLGINTGFSGNTESFANGDECSGAGVERSATFIYVTDPSASAVTGVVEEVETCVYEITITSPHDCDEGGDDDEGGQCTDLSVEDGEVYTFYSNGDGDNGDEGCYQVTIGSSATQDNAITSAFDCTKSAFSSTTNLGTSTGFDGNTESFAGGDECSGAGVYRSAMLTYITDQSASAETGSVTEPDTCVYEITITSPYDCDTTRRRIRRSRRQRK